jgi:hypothetical protein
LLTAIGSPLQAWQQPAPSRSWQSLSTAQLVSAVSRTSTTVHWLATQPAMK